MSHWVETTAKTVDLAIEQALATLGVGVDDVVIEVIEEGEAGGLLGFGRKPARVRVSLADDMATAQTMPDDTPHDDVNAYGHAPDESFGDDDDEDDVDDEDDETTVGRVPKRTGEHRGGVVTPEMEDKALDYVQAIVQGLNIHGRIGSYIDDEGTLHIEVTGKDCGPAIGRHGDTLEAIGYMTRLVVNRMATEHVRVALDIGGYHARRERIVQDMIRRKMAKVERTGQPLCLDPMPSHERRLVHLMLRDHPHLTSYSQGIDPNRCVVIAPAHEDV